MGNVVDNFLKAMRLNSDEDDDFYDDETYEDDDFDEEPAPKRSKRREKVKEDLEDGVKETKEKGRRSSKVTPIRANSQQMDGWAVCIVEATAVDAGKKVADILLSNRPVLLNIAGVSEEDAQRIVDFSCGACSALHGHSKKVDYHNFLFTPLNIEISGQSSDTESINQESGIRMNF